MKGKKKEIQATTIIKEGRLTAIASTEDEDRSGDVLRVKDWDFSRFELNPVLQAGHDYRPQFTIGKAENLRIEQGKVLFDPVFHTITPLAKQIKEMYEKGFLKAWSVGFIPGSRQLKGEASGSLNELLEVSAVAVPANAFALMKGFEDSTDVESKIKEWVGEEDAENVDTPIVEDVADEDESDIEESSVEEELAIEESTEKNSGEDDEDESEDEEVDDDGLLVEDDADEVVEDSFDDAESKGILEIVTGKSNDHVHKASYDEKTGSGSTDAVNGHVHRIKDFEIQEADGHTHSLETNSVIEAKKYKKPKKKEVERWNKQLPAVFNKEFDTETIVNVRMSFQNDVFTKFFDCEVKDLFVNNYSVPSALIGSYLAGFKAVSEDFELADTRNWHGDMEYPPLYEVIQLNAEKSEEFLIEGIQFYKVKGQNYAVVKFDVGWSGINASIITNNADRDWNKALLEKTHKWVKENNYLKGEKFALSGEFLTSNKTWEDVVLDKTVKDTVVRNVQKVATPDAKSRGLLFVGPPGTGKTMTGKIMMKESDSTFIWVSSQDMWRIGPVGALKVAFQLARDLAPSILFIEDVDTWLRGPAMDLLKTEMDGVRENKGLITVLTSNEPESFPDALLDRPGRFHEVLEFGNPDESVRKEMIQKWAGDMSETIVGEIVEKTQGFSGAYIKELIDYALVIAEDEDVAMEQAILRSLAKLVEQRELVQRIRQAQKSYANIEVKAGRVISQKNRNILTEARDALTKVLSIEESTAKEDEEVKGISEFNPDKVVKTNVTKKSVKPDAESIALRALQLIAKTSNESLHKAKKGIND